MANKDIYSNDSVVKCFSRLFQIFKKKIVDDSMKWNGIERWYCFKKKTIITFPKYLVKREKEKKHIYRIISLQVTFPPM
jgi:hypothetical protein